MSKSEKCPRCGSIQECLIGGTPHYACLSTVSVSGKFIQDRGCRIRELEHRLNEACKLLKRCYSQLILEDELLTKLQIDLLDQIELFLREKK